jgi:hypothetical protein
MDAELQDLSRNKVRYAAVEITNIAQDLHSLDLTRYYPTTGVTVLLPAVIIHLLDIKSSDPSIRMTSLQRFYQCMRILQRLREIYASADFATSFLEAAIRKAGIQLTVAPQDVQSTRRSANSEGSRLDTLTPPPDSLAQKIPDLTYPNPKQATAGARTVSGLFASTPPHSDGSENGSTNNLNPNFAPADPLTVPALDSEMSLTELMDLANDAEVTQNDFDALINFDDAGNDFFAADENGGPSGTTVADHSMSVMFDPIDPNPKAVDFANPDRDGHSEARAAEAPAHPPAGLTTDLDTDLGLTVGE